MSKTEIVLGTLQDLSGPIAMVGTLGTLGTPINMATMPLLFEKSVTSFLPLSSSSAMSQPFHRLKYASFAPHFDTFGNSLPKFVKDKSASSRCILSQDDDFGFDTQRGTEAGPGLNTEALVKSMDSLTAPSDLFGSPELTFSPTKHLGSTQSRLSQIPNSRWRVISNYM